MQLKGSRAGLMIVCAALLLLTASPVAAEDHELSRRKATGRNDGGSLLGEAGDEVPGRLVNNNQSSNSGPNCTKEDGTRDYLRYKGLMYTTMEQQRTVIRPEEQRPGEYLHVYCGDERIGFYFFPEDEPVDPRYLADTVRITPPDPVLVTSPAATEQLVDIEVWFWVETWEPLSADASAGDVSVTVSAVPSTLIIDPGDGSPTFECSGPQAVYDPALPADAQSSDCTHTYTRAGNYTATATLVYDASFTSNVPGAGGGLGTIETTSTLDLAVAEAQAINTQAGG